MTTPMMDMAQSMTFEPRLHSHRWSRDARGILTAQRMRLRAAERFTLEDDAVRLICRLSHDRNHIEKWSTLARLPYDKMWIEFSQHVKLKEFEDMDTLHGPFKPDEVSPQVGYLFFREDPGGTSQRWVCHEWTLYKGKATPGFLAFVFDPDGTGIAPVRGSTHWRAPTLSDIPGFPRMKAVINYDDDGTKDEATMDMEYALLGLFETASYETGKIVCPELLASRSAVIMEPLWHRQHTDLGLTKKLNEIVYAACKEQSGLLRWLITFLASINALPRDARPVERRPGKRTIGMHQIPYLQHKTLTINLPRDNRVVYAAKQMNNALANYHAKRPWHRVLGHWRVIERGKSKHWCRHHPAMIENDVAICEKCELLVRWIHPHERGDPTIGIVHHEYRVTT